MKKYTMLKQVCNLIPPHLVKRLAREYGVDEKSRTFTPWSHVTSLLYAHITHAIGLNDVCDGLQMNKGALATIRGATPPTRNNLSHANKVRDSAMAEALYWEMLEYLTKHDKNFAQGKIRRGYLRRFHKTIYAVDSTTVQLVANCLDWAKHRRRKAAAKCHLRLNLQSFLPSCAIIDTAKFHDASRARDVCAGLRAGEIVVFDKAYVDFTHLHELTERKVYWVTRAKGNMHYVVERTLPSNNPRILSDFLGHNANAVQWQMWMGLLVHLLLRYLAHLSAWGHSFTRLFTVIRAVLWRCFNHVDLLESYGTAKPPGRICGCPEQAYLPGFG